MTAAIAAGRSARAVVCYSDCETGPFLCAAGLGCIDGLCVPLSGEGGSCTLDNRCPADLGCDFLRAGRSLCAPRAGPRRACEADPICAAGTYYNFQVLFCTAIEPAGPPCSAGNECSPEGACVPDAAGDFRCAPPPGSARLVDQCVGDALACRADLRAAACVPDVCRLILDD